ncbi:metallophosphoesterase family protein [Marinithermus hydrothermalis]|uniref:Nuclease SbcCD subunit D n=1 Tax=Marinithermus hydrothermalis (strain DSM 14884 / JCM 11576 / T1) TaxID=869210 RepID=F2NLG0_MARHT|nr:exonuclease SbcCD subunit D [Marinithermus hydrothermalis]AEB12059.1 nuclease SbcCD, D subunit [Marinithermus hydrothermalis DSM 14884]
MRILHTADWHLGKTLKGVDRTPEIALALRELLEVVRSERVDLVIVAGDLFDRPVVSAEAEAAAFEFFLGLKELGVPALVIAGNHDARERLEALAPLLLLAGTTALGRVRLREDGGVYAFSWGRAALLPFLSERRLVKAVHLLEEDGGTWKGRYADGMRRVIQNLAAGFDPEGVNLLVAHLTVEGAHLRLGGGEFAFYVSNSYAVPATALPATAHYVALGHIHRQQQVAEAPVAWYAGSLIQLDFGEGEDAPRGALLVEVEPGRLPQVHALEARWGKPLRTYRMKLEHLDRRWDEVRDWPGYARLVLEGPGNPALRERIYRELPGVLDVQFTGSAEAQPVEAMARPEELDWLEAYAAYLRDVKGVELSEAQREAFKRVYEEVHGE